MTDARLPERWLNDRRLLRLPDDAFRLFVTSLMWSVANKTDGVLYDDDLRLIPGADPGGHAQLVKGGLWKREWDRWVITEFADSQTSATELDAIAARRRSDRQRKAAERLRKAAASRDASRDSHAESVRTGQARQGQAPRNVVPGNTTSANDGYFGGPTTQSMAGGGSRGDAVSPPAAAADSSLANGATPSQSLRDPDGPGNHGADDQHDSIEVHLQSSAADRNAREASGYAPEPRRPCPRCGLVVAVMPDGRLRVHGSLHNRCPGSRTYGHAASAPVRPKRNNGYTGEGTCGECGRTIAVRFGRIHTHKGSGPGRCAGAGQPPRTVTTAGTS